MTPQEEFDYFVAQYTRFFRDNGPALGTPIRADSLPMAVAALRLDYKNVILSPYPRMRRGDGTRYWVSTEDEAFKVFCPELPQLPEGVAL